MNPKPNKKLSLGAGSNVTIASTGFFTQSQVLLSSIVCLVPSLINPQAAFAFRVTLSDGSGKEILDSLES